MTNEEVISNWKAGKEVDSCSLGGLGDEYEEAIQTLAFEIFSTWDTSKPTVNEDGSKVSKEFETHAQVKTVELDQKWGFSGAQVGAAKRMAFQFAHYGYGEMMKKLPADRLIKAKRPETI